MKPVFKSKKLNGLSKEEFNKQAYTAKQSYAAKHVTKETCIKGAKSTEERFRAEYGDNYNNEMKSKLYDNLKDKESFHKKGAAVHHAKNTKSIDERNLLVIADLPSEPFTLKEVGSILQKHGRDPRYLTNIMLRHPLMFKCIGKTPRIGSAGNAEKIFIKIA